MQKKAIITIFMVILTTSIISCQSRNIEDGLIGQWIIKDLEPAILSISENKLTIQRFASELGNINREITFDTRSIYFKNDHGIERKLYDYEI